jgi:phosphatidate cytidylyltransferase
MLRWRLLMSVVFIAGLVGLIWLDAQTATPGSWLMPLALAVSVLACEEMLHLLAARDLRPAPWVCYLGCLSIVASNYASIWAAGPLTRLEWPLTVFALSLLAAFFAEMRRYERPGQTMERLGVAVLTLGYVGVLLSFVVQTRLLGPNGAYGIAALASLVIVVKMCDIGAYTVGRLVGRTKLAPTLSPGKTIEGCAGGIAFALFGAWVWQSMLLPALVTVTPDTSSAPPTWGWIAFGLLVGLAGMLGDLAESLIKRDVGRKDSSSWMPGFGGVLDVIDSILIAAPVAYLCWIFHLVGP